jgi:hypothetical protein
LLGERILLALGGQDLAEALVQPGAVVSADVHDQGELEPAARSPDAVADRLGLEAAKERLGDVVAASSRSTRVPTHRFCI